MNILGINGLLFGRDSSYGTNTFVHDSGITLLVNGELKTALLEERFTRVKHDGSFPINAINNALLYNNLKVDDIDIVAYVDNMALIDKFDLKDRNEFMKITLKKYFPKSLIKIIDHHESHAFAAFVNSPFEIANVLTFDFNGDAYYSNPLLDKNCNSIFNNFSFSTYTKSTKSVIKHYNNLNSTHDMFSLGAFYSEICYTVFCMLYPDYETSNKHTHGLEGKIMGLAGYGDPSKINIQNPFTIIKKSEYDFPIIYRKNRGVNLERNTKPEDFAAWGQKVFEDTLCEFVSLLPKSVKQDYICLGGGCALNVLANSILIERGLYKDGFVCSAPSDEGLSMGAAYHVAWQSNQDIILPNNTGCLGINYTKAQIEEALEHMMKNHSNLKVTYYDNQSEYLENVVKLIKEKTCVAWFHGKGEFGPRALGNRSILVNPTEDIKDYLNDKIKYREYWRPYAGLVIEEKLNEYFEIPKKSSPYMMFSSIVKQEYRDKLQGITHKDNTCRIQTVTKDTNNLVYELLLEVEKQLGLPVLLNTSYNTQKGEPIVEIPSSAIFSFLNSNLDVMAMEGYIVEKN